MATSIIPNPERITTISLTLNGVSGYVTLIACGRIATLTGVLHSYSPGTNMGLAWIPGAGSSEVYNYLYPMQNVWLSCDFYDASGARPRGEVEMRSTGVLSVSCQSTDAQLKISGSWITKG